MPRLPGISSQEAIRVFTKIGFRVVRQSGHLVMSNGKVRLIIPRHNPINAITMGPSLVTPLSLPKNFAGCSEFA